MHVLALDTTTREGSVALVTDGTIVEERRGDATRTHAERLPGELVAVAAAHGLAIGDIDLFAVASGPGSFTGLRIGIATVQGLAFTAGRPVVAVSALEALAVAGAAAQPQDALVGAWMDAHRREIFAALYRVTGPAIESAVVELEGPTVGGPAATLSRWADLAGGASLCLIGDGAVAYRDLIEGAGLSVTVVEAPLLAGTIGRLAGARASRDETIDPAAIRPLYVRRPDAELARDSSPPRTSPGVAK